jgi:hypothetical protein
MWASRRLVEDVDRSVARHLDGELQLASPPESVSSSCRARDSRADVSQAFEHDPDRLLGEEVASLLDRHREGLDDVPAAEAVLEDVVGVATALAHLAHADDLGHEPEAGVGLAQAVAVRAGALGVRAEQGGLDTVLFRERGPDGIEDAGIGRRVRAP